MLRTSICIALVLIPGFAWAAPRAYNQKLDKYVEVKPLDDPSNPYKDQYQDWDRWLLSNAYQPTEDEPYPLEDNSIDYYVLSSRTDENGWLLPQIEMQQLRCERLRRRKDNILNSVFPFEIDGAGPMPEIWWLPHMLPLRKCVPGSCLKFPNGWPTLRQSGALCCQTAGL